MSFNKYKEKKTPKPTVVRDLTTDKEVRDLPATQAVHQVKDAESFKLAVSVVCKSNTVTPPITNPIVVLPPPLVPKNTSGQATNSPQVEQKQANDVNKAKPPIPHSNKEPNKIEYKYELIESKVLSKTTVPPSEVADEKTSKKEEWKFCGIVEQDGKWSIKYGSYQPAFKTKRGGVKESKFTCEGLPAPKVDMFDLILFEKEGLEIKYLLMKNPIIVPINVFYPKPDFEIKEMKNIPDDLLTAINTLNCFTFRLYIEVGNNLKTNFLNNIKCEISKKHVIEIEYEKEFVAVVESNPRILDAFKCVDYKAYLGKLEIEKKALSDLRNEVEKKEDDLKTLRETKRNLGKNKLSLPPDDEIKMKTLESEIAKFYPHKADDKKEIPGKIQEQKVKIAELEKQKKENFKNLEGKIPVILTITPNRLSVIE